MWSIESERTQAQHFALRAALQKDLHEDPSLFKELVGLCERKIEIFKQIELRAEFLESLTTDMQPPAPPGIKLPDST